MRRNLLFSLFLVLGLGLTLSSCAPGAYVGASVGAPYPYYGRPYYGPRYYGPRYYARPVPPPRPYYHGRPGDGPGPGRPGGGYHGGSRRGGR